MKKPFFIFLYFFCFISLKSWGTDIKSTVALEGETFNFELSGQKNWDYDLKRVKDKEQVKIQLFVKSLEQSVIDKISNIENPFVKSISVQKNAIDNRWLIEFVLKNNQVEAFDYLTDQPSKLVIDFYKSDIDLAEQSVTTATVVAEKSPLNKNLKKINTDRRPATTDILTIDKDNNEQIKNSASADVSALTRFGLYDAGDSQFGRFTMKDSEYKEESVIRSRNNYYLRFPVLESEFSFWQKMKENSPAYEIQPISSDADQVTSIEENKQARLLKTLFTKKRFLVFIQTAEWFKSKYPSSKYNEMVLFMTGDAFIELWKSEKIESLYEQAQNAYREALEKYPESILTERTSLLTGMLAIDKLDYMSAIRKLQTHIDNKRFDNKISKQYAQLGLAYSYAKINKLSEAMQILSDIEKNTRDEYVLAEVAVRKGDFNFTAKKFSESIGFYESAIKKYPMASKLFPSVHFNKMEAQFWQTKFQDAHQSALSFAQNFPTHDFAPYSLTRVGELLDILGAEPSKSVGAYLETHFRYGNNSKTIVARLHLLSARMKSMKSEELEKTLAQMEELALKSELQNIDQFKVAMVSDGFSERKEYLKAIDILSKFHQLNPSRPDAEQVMRRIAKNINDQLNLLAAKGNYKELLATYRKYSDTWLKTYTRLDTDYFLGLAYENVGVFSQAVEKYKKVLTNLLTIKGIAAEKEIYINQHLPSFDTLYLRLAKSSYDNALYQEAYQYLEKIRTPLALSDIEQVERVQLASNLYEKKGDMDSSVRYLSDLSNFWKGDKKLTLPVQFKLAEIQIKKNNISTAIAVYEKCREIIFENDKPEQGDLFRLLDSYSDLLIAQDKKDDAIVFLNEALQRHGDKFNLNRQRYLLGELYFTKGETKKAEQVWSNIKEDAVDVWKKLSQEKLRQAAWDGDYKKHLKRIPAVSQLEDQK